MELSNIMANAREQVYAEIFMFVFYTGMRTEEILNLQWNNIDFHIRSIHLENSEYFTTTNKKDRIVPMHEKINQ